MVEWPVSRLFFSTGQHNTEEKMKNSHLSPERDMTPKSHRVPSKLYLPNVSYVFTNCMGLLLFRETHFCHYFMCRYPEY
jgi:hypothetical protein